MHCFGLFYSFFLESTWESLLKCYSLSTWLASHQPRPCSLQKSFITDSNWGNQSLTTSTSGPPPRGGWEYILISAILEVLNYYQGAWVGLFSLFLSLSFLFSFAACSNLPRPLASLRVDSHQGALEWTMVRTAISSLLSYDIIRCDHFHLLWRLLCWASPHLTLPLSSLMWCSCNLWFISPFPENKSVWWQCFGKVLGSWHACRRTALWFTSFVFGSAQVWG